MVKSAEDVNLEYRLILLSLSESIIPSARISMRSLVIHLHERGCIILFHPSPIHPYFRLPLQRAGTVYVYGVVSIPHICHFFTQAKFLENKIYTEI